MDGIHKLGNPLVDGLGRISAHFFHLKIASEFKHSQEVVDLLFIVLIELETTRVVVKYCVCREVLNLVFGELLTI